MKSCNTTNTQSQYKSRRGAVADQDDSDKNVSPSKKYKSKKVKLGEMKIVCDSCNTRITKVVESRDSLRIKLKGFCEQCKTPKVAYVDDVQKIIESGRRFDYIVRENTPGAPNTNTPQTSVPQPASQTQQPKPATTPTPPTPPKPVDTAAVNKVIADAISQLGKVLGTSAVDPKVVQDAVNTHFKASQQQQKPPQPVAPGSAQPTPAGAAQPVK